ncbi:GIY-YIG nuclease family protein [Ramlibacter alkalitolerans]|uniref:GIY-YIG nuclease family protein n=1 Tax=Ramlibacter alkalitolerans TaxID=2039631 RepID=A0ABS1JWQ5_9BURK|nr:GIY-YIG nuclease family protein [Ramlibacter alkalitolerans]MBL0428755.1 GIY-YIG nuclease family protein [Ramlibacter alkalitolerans]
MNRIENSGMQSMHLIDTPNFPFVVYRIRNRYNNRSYIGSSRNVKARWAAHRRSIDSGTGLSAQMRVDMETYGYELEDFAFEIFRRFQSEDSMLRFEQALQKLRWGTFQNYNTAPEVRDDWVSQLWLAWHLHSVDMRQYLSWQAPASDLDIPRAEARHVAQGRVPCVREWVIEPLTESRTKESIEERFRHAHVPAPTSDTIAALWRSPELYRREYFITIDHVQRPLFLPINPHQYSTCSLVEYEQACTRLANRLKEQRATETWQIERLQRRLKHFRSIVRELRKGAPCSSPSARTQARRGAPQT